MTDWSIYIVKKLFDVYLSEWTVRESADLSPLLKAVSGLS